MSNKEFHNRFVSTIEFRGRPAVTPEQAELNRQTGKGPKRARPAIEGLVPMPESTFWLRVKQGKIPPPIEFMGILGWWLADLRKAGLQ